MTTLGIVFGSILVYGGVAVYFHRRYVYNMIANSTARWGPDALVGEIFFGAAVLALLWPVTFWYAFAGPDSRESYALAPRSVRQRERAEAAERRVRELEREHGVVGRG